MLAALLLAAVVSTPPECARLEVAATGRSAHGSAVMPESAPHLLIRALDRLPRWVESDAAITRGRIVNLAASRAINIIPRRASATLEIRFDPTRATREQLRDGLSTIAGTKVEVTLDPEPCALDNE